MARSPRVPWKRPNPRKRAGKATKHLTPAEKSAAKARAARAGRSYPNLVDNMRAAAKKGTKTKTSGRKRAAKKQAKKQTKPQTKTQTKTHGRRPASKRPAARKSSAARKHASHKTTAREKDPRGG